MNHPSLSLSALRRTFVFRATGALLVLAAAVPSAAAQTQSVARQWDELQLTSIRKDLARPVVSARNLYHVSVAMFDAWATYDFSARPVLFHENHATNDPQVEDFRNEAISYASYRVLRERYQNSPGAAIVLPLYDAKMAELGYDKDFTSQVGDSPAAIGNRIAQTVIDFGLFDNSNEQGNYANKFYVAKNEPVIPALPGDPKLLFPNNWQPIAIDFFIDQNGNPVPGGSAKFLGAEWGAVLNFGLPDADKNVYQKEGHDWTVYHDPGPHPQLGTPSQSDYIHTFTMVSTWSSHLTPFDGVMIDASPNHIGNSTLPDTIADYDQFYDFLQGGDNGTGYALNPVTGQPYPSQVVPRGDYTRCLAEFWADGPTSETPPGHWFVLLNYVGDQPGFEKRFAGIGPVVSDLEWDVKSYLAMGGTMHDAAVTCWGIKGWYDGVRPISAIRYMADHGQSTDTQAANYSPVGLPLIPGFVQTVTEADTAPGGEMESLFGAEGEVAIKAWRGPPFIANPATDTAGVDWILAKNWWPYQRPSFVTPPFGGYTSGHSTYSRAGATVMDKLTGSPWFPNGLGEFTCPQNSYLVFEEGPSVTMKLQWASYYDASDQCSLSRIWGGIHPPADDIPARKNGILVGNDSFKKAVAYWSPWTYVGDGLAGSTGVPPVLAGVGTLVANSAGSLDLSYARPSSGSLLFASLTSVPTAFKGGVLYTNPVTSSIPMVTQPNGQIHLAFTWPDGIPSGVEMFFQYGIRDPVAVQGVSLSNALKATTP